MECAQINSKLIQDIKVLGVATTIMEMTRRLSKEEKRYVKTFCDKLLFNKKLQDTKEQETIPGLTDYHYKKINPGSISSVKDLQFKKQQTE